MDAERVESRSEGGNPDFVSITAASNYELSPELKQPNTWETTVSYERELAPSLGFRVMYINKIVDGSLETINAKRPVQRVQRSDHPPRSWPRRRAQQQRRRRPFTLYDYAATAYRGAAFELSKRVNADNTDRFHSMEFTLTKRASSRGWGRSRISPSRITAGSPASSRIRTTSSSRSMKRGPGPAMSAGPTGCPSTSSVSGFLQSKSGVKGQRTNIFRTADPDGGTPITQQRQHDDSPRAVRQPEPVGLQHPELPREQGFPDERRAAGSAIDFDIFNLLNSATPTGADFASGPTFGYATGVVPPLITRIGARFTF